MCRDNDHGGRRCPHDTSAHRQARRLAAKERQAMITSQLRNSYTHEVSNLAYEDLDGIRARALELRERANQPQLDRGSLTEVEWQRAQDERDEILEEEITAFGKVLAARAESLAGFRKAEFEEKLTALETEVYGGLRGPEETAAKKVREAYKGLSGLVSAAATASGVPSWEVYTWTREDFERQLGDLITDQQKEMLGDLVAAQQELKTAQAASEQADAVFEARESALYVKARGRLTAAHRRVIAEIREVGGGVSFNTAVSDPDAAKLLTTTVGQHYPAAWLSAHKTSADGAELVVSNSNDRAGYLKKLAADDMPQPEKVFFYLNFTSENEEFAPVMALLPSEAKHGRVKYQNGTERAMASFFHDRTELYDPTVHGPLKKGRPAGDGWVYGSTVMGANDQRLATTETEVESVRILTEPRWSRPVLTSQATVPTLKIYANVSTADPGSDTDEPNAADNLAAGDSTAAAIAYHEFGHRMEEVLPHGILPRQERAFLMRRAGKSGMDRDDQYDQMEMIITDEFAHRNTDMVAKYMAREYFTNDAFEVFQTGVEAVFGGAYGGLMGLSTRYGHQDHEHRGFVLGTLAVL